MDNAQEQKLMEETVEQSKQPVDNTPIPKEVPKYEENQLLREDWTFDGPIETRWVGGKEVKILPTPQQSANLPQKFKPAHVDALHMMYLLYETLPKQQGRSLPLFQSEILQVVPKKIFRQLEMYDLVKTRLVPLVDPKGKPIGGQMLCWLTPEGKYMAQEIKKKVDARRQELQAQHPTPETPEVHPTQGENP
jgi:hypothetical protein